MQIGWPLSTKITGQPHRALILWLVVPCPIVRDSLQRMRHPRPICQSRKSFFGVFAPQARPLHSRSDNIKQGSRKMLAIRSAPIMKADSNPKCEIGTKLENPKTKKARVRTTEVANMGPPTFLRLSLVESEMDNPV